MPCNQLNTRRRIPRCRPESPGERIFGSEIEIRGARIPDIKRGVEIKATTGIGLERRPAAHELGIYRLGRPPFQRRAEECGTGRYVAVRDEMGRDEARRRAGLSVETGP